MTMLQTERLTLRPLVPADAEAYAAMRYHPEVAKWLPPADGDPVDAARATIERFAAVLAGAPLRAVGRLSATAG